MVSNVSDLGEAADGRHARRQRNRDAVVDAMLALYAEGNLAPSSDEIAVRAGISSRSVFRYFDDIDDLARSAIARQQERVRPLVDVAIHSDGPLSDRVAAAVSQRMALFDEIASVGQVTRLRAPFHPVILEELTLSRAYLRRQLQRWFAPELAALDAAAGSRLLAAIDVLCSFEAVHLLRNDQGLSRSQTIGVLATTLTTLLTNPPSLEA